MINVYRVKVQTPKPLVLLEGWKREESRPLLPQSSRTDILMGVRPTGSRKLMANIKQHHQQHHPYRVSPGGRTRSRAQGASFATYFHTRENSRLRLTGEPQKARTPGRESVSGHSPLSPTPQSAQYPCHTQRENSGVTGAGSLPELVAMVVGVTRMDPTPGDKKLWERCGRRPQHPITVTTTPQPQRHTHPHFSGGCPGKSPIPTVCTPVHPLLHSCITPVSFCSLRSLFLRLLSQPI